MGSPELMGQPRPTGSRRPMRITTPRSPCPGPLFRRSTAADLVEEWCGRHSAPSGARLRSAVRSGVGATPPAASIGAAAKAAAICASPRRERTPMQRSRSLVASPVTHLHRCAVPAERGPAMLASERFREIARREAGWRGSGFFAGRHGIARRAGARSHHRLPGGYAHVSRQSWAPRERWRACHVEGGGMPP